MGDYPAAGDQAGFVYNRDRDLPMSAYNNAKAAGYLTAALATTTTVSNVDIRAGDIVILAPANAKAAHMLKGGLNCASGIYVSATALGSFTVTHDSNSTAQGSVFYYSVLRNF